MGRHKDELLVQASGDVGVLRRLLVAAAVRMGTHLGPSYQSGAEAPALWDQGLTFAASDSTARTADELNDRIAEATRKRWSATVLLKHIVAAGGSVRRRNRIGYSRLGDQHRTGGKWSRRVVSPQGKRLRCAAARGRGA